MLAMGQNSGKVQPPPANNEEGFFDEEENLDDNGDVSLEESEPIRPNGRPGTPPRKSRFSGQNRANSRPKEEETYTPPVVNNRPTTPVEDIELERSRRRSRKRTSGRGEKRVSGGPRKEKTTARAKYDWQPTAVEHLQRCTQAHDRLRNSRHHLVSGRIECRSSSSVSRLVSADD